MMTSLPGFSPAAPVKAGPAFGHVAPRALLQPAPADSVQFSGSARSDGSPPEPTPEQVLEIVQEMALEFFISQAKVDPDTVQIIMHGFPVVRASYDYGFSQGELNESSSRRRYIAFGEDEDGTPKPVAGIDLSYDPQRKEWMGVSISAMQGEFFTGMQELTPQYPSNTEFKFVEGLPSTATGAIKAIVAQVPGQKENIHILATTNSEWPGTFPASEYPFRPGQVLSREEFMKGLDQCGRLEEERFVQILVSDDWSGDPKARLLLEEMIGDEMTRRLLNSAKPLQQLPERVQELTLRNTIKRVLDKVAINGRPYLDRFDDLGGAGG